MEKADLKKEKASALEGGCENVEGSLRQLLCRVCSKPVLGPALPICGNHAYVGQ